MELKDLSGKKIKSITGCEVDSGSFIITFDDGTWVEFCHNQDCCERVSIEDVVGDPENHIGAILYSIDEKSNSDSINPSI
jgi:hypothetical protein